MSISISPLLFFFYDDERNNKNSGGSCYLKQVKKFMNKNINMIDKIIFLIQLDIKN